MKLICLLSIYLISCQEEFPPYGITETQANGYQHFKIQNCSALRQERYMSSSWSIWINNGKYMNGYIGKKGLTCWRRDAVSFSNPEEALNFINRLGIEHNIDPIEGKITAYVTP